MLCNTVMRPPVHTQAACRREPDPSEIHMHTVPAFPGNPSSYAAFAAPDPKYSHRHSVQMS